jgi:hypothetical protein
MASPTTPVAGDKKKRRPGKGRREMSRSRRREDAGQEISG